MAACEGCESDCKKCDPTPPAFFGTSGPLQLLPETTWERLKPPREAVKAYTEQAKQAHAVFVKALEVFNDQRKHYGDPVTTDSLAVAMRALEHMTLLTGKIHGV